MIRRYNYTGRKKVLSKRVTIIEAIKDGNKSFRAKFDFEDLGFPDEAKVYIEPYFKTSSMRFDFGTVARPIEDVDMLVNELPTSDQIRYRIKIVDSKTTNGLILGFAVIDGTLSNNLSGGRQAILPVDFIDLGKRIWTLEFRDIGPVLAVNCTIENIREKVKSDDNFFSLVYPEVIKRIAFEIVNSEDFDEDELNDWKSEWMKFFKIVLMQTSIPNSEDDIAKEEWANDVSDAFARKYNVVQRYTQLNQ